MGTQQIYCSICGAPILGSSGSFGGQTEWLNKAILLSTVHKTEDGDKLDEYWARPPPIRSTQPLYTIHLGSNPPEEASRSVVRFEARGNGSHEFELVPSGERVAALTIPDKYPIPRPKTPGQAHGHPFYLPIHRQCSQIANLFVDSKAMSMPPEDRIATFKQLWEILSRRMYGSFGTQMQVLPEPHDYFGGRLCRGVDWEGGNDPKHGELHEQNPLEILDLTASILKNLEPLPADGKEVVKAKVQVKDRTTSEDYRNLQNADLECDYIHSPNWWYDAFTNKKTFPWLWDLDVYMIRDKLQSGCWNWERLVRQLSQTKIHEPDDTTLTLPLALRNRRRIWRLLDEARLNDVAEVEEKKMAARAEERAAEEKRWLETRPPGPWVPQGLGTGFPGPSESQNKTT